ncbi:hypothetical protein JCM11641_001938 [Rhodosporidiobolus odoratus]
MSQGRSAKLFAADGDFLTLNKRLDHLARPIWFRSLKLVSPATNRGVNSTDRIFDRLLTGHKLHHHIWSIDLDFENQEYSELRSCYLACTFPQLVNFKLTGSNEGDVGYSLDEAAPSVRHLECDADTLSGILLYGANGLTSIVTDISSDASSVKLVNRDRIERIHLTHISSAAAAAQAGLWSKQSEDASPSAIALKHLTLKLHGFGRPSPPFIILGDLVPVLRALQTSSLEALTIYKSHALERPKNPRLRLPTAKLNVFRTFADQFFGATLDDPEGFDIKRYREVDPVDRAFAYPSIHASLFYLSSATAVQDFCWKAKDYPVELRWTRRSRLDAFEADLVREPGSFPLIL